MCGIGWVNSAPSESVKDRLVVYRLLLRWDSSWCGWCPHFSGWYVQTSMELGPEDVSLNSVHGKLVREIKKEKPLNKTY